MSLFLSQYCLEMLKLPLSLTNPIILSNNLEYLSLPSCPYIVAYLLVKIKKITMVYW